MALRGAQILQFQEALLSAYDGPGLAQMVRIRLDEDLAAVAGGANLSETVFNLILWAERTGRTEELVVGASASNPQNALLKTFTSQYLAGAGGQAAAGAAAAGATGTSETSRPNQTINTGGGAYIGGNVSTGGGAFVGRDQIVSGDKERDK
ncbi:MAG: effector-associated domain EAD1-containing protein [Caldilineaceae bacterium]